MTHFSIRSVSRHQPITFGTLSQEENRENVTHIWEWENQATVNTLHWRTRIEDKLAWKKIVKKAKTHPGL
jgi:hypothetical protein